MKKGKKIILVILLGVLLAFITSMFVLLVRNIVDIKVTNDQIKGSKYKMRTDMSNYGETLQMKLNNVRANLNENDYATIVKHSKLLIEEVNTVESKIDSANWCNTRKISYNADCREYKEVLKKKFKKVKLAGELSIKLINDPENDELLDEIIEIKADVEKDDKEFEKKTQEFFNKTY